LGEPLNKINHLRPGVHWSRGVARTDRVYPYAAVDPLHRQRTREVAHRGLGAVVMHLLQASVDDGSRHGADVDDRAAALPQHRLRFCLAAQEHACDINVVNPLPLLNRHGLRRRGVGDPRGVDCETQRAEGRFGPFHRSAQLGEVRDVSTNGDTTSTGFENALGGILVGLLCQVDQPDGCTAAGYRLGDGSPDAAGGSGHQCHFALQ
jgi:hypothetical protein